MNNLTKMLRRNFFFSNVIENVVRKFLNDNFTSDSPQSAAHKENCLYLNYHISLLFPSQHNTELRNLLTHFAVTLILSWCLSHLKLRVGLGSRIISLRVDDCKLLIRFHVQAVVPVMLVKHIATRIHEHLSSDKHSQIFALERFWKLLLPLFRRLF